MKLTYIIVHKKLLNNVFDRKPVDNVMYAYVNIYSYMRYILLSTFFLYYLRVQWFGA